MNEHQIPTLYLFGIIGLMCGIAGLILSTASFLAMRRTKLKLKAALKIGQDVMAGQQKASEENAQIKRFLEKALRELEHDHDQQKDTLEGYAQSLARLEAVAATIRDNQHNYMIKNNSAANGNKVKINNQPPESYFAALMRAHPPEACKTCNLN